MPDFLLLDTIDALNELTHICHTVCLVWIPSHTGISGNKRADSLAKLGTAIDALESPYLPLRPLVSSRGAVLHVVLETWSTNWTAYSGGRMTKDFLPRPNAGQVCPLLTLDRTTLARCVAFLTGHNNLRYHHSLRDPGVSPECRFCLLSPGTAAHLYTDCLCFSTLWFDLNGLFFHPVFTSLLDRGPSGLLPPTRFDLYRDGRSPYITICH